MVGLRSELGDVSVLNGDNGQTGVGATFDFTSLMKGVRLVTPVGGGVHVEAELALESTNLLPDDDAQVEEVVPSELQDIFGV